MRFHSGLAFRQLFVNFSISREPRSILRPGSNSNLTIVNPYFSLHFEKFGFIWLLPKFSQRIFNENPDRLTLFRYAIAKLMQNCKLLFLNELTDYIGFEGTFLTSLSAQQYRSYLVHCLLKTKIYSDVCWDAASRIRLSQCSKLYLIGIHWWQTWMEDKKKGWVSIYK